MTRKEMYLPIEKADKNAAQHVCKKRKPEGFPCNVYVSAESGSEVMCCGKVLLNEPVPFPNYFLEE